MIIKKGKLITRRLNRRPGKQANRRRVSKVSFFRLRGFNGWQHWHSNNIKRETEGSLGLDLFGLRERLF